ncbi:UNVERIFIED_CONTAM: hypothetical protein Sangu_2112900 [Sesamum angustifolium]|uniref:Uncharacterized protein n=1 Tax=Sesamum angustifolium TaxID=2727405 RepID=A0AAW2LFK3_9LAMI
MRVGGWMGNEPSSNHVRRVSSRHAGSRQWFDMGTHLMVAAVSRGKRLELGCSRQRLELRGRVSPPPQTSSRRCPPVGGEGHQSRKLGLLEVLPRAH